MEHKVGNRKLQKSTAHRLAMLNNMVTSLIEHERITSMLVVPTMLQRILALPAETLYKHDTSSLRWIMSGAAPLPTEVARRADIGVEERALGRLRFSSARSKRAQQPRRRFGRNGPDHLDAGRDQGERLVVAAFVRRLPHAQHGDAPAARREILDEAHHAIDAG